MVIIISVTSDKYDVVLLFVTNLFDIQCKNVLIKQFENWLAFPSFWAALKTVDRFVRIWTLRTTFFHYIFKYKGSSIIDVTASIWGVREFSEGRSCLNDVIYRQPLIEVATKQTICPITARQTFFMLKLSLLC